MGEINSISGDVPPQTTTNTDEATGKNDVQKMIDLRKKKLVITFDIDKTAINSNGELDTGFLKLFTTLYINDKNKLFDIYFIPMTSNSINEVNDCVKKIKNGLRPTIKESIKNSNKNSNKSITDKELNQEIEDELNRIQFPYATTYCGSIIHKKDDNNPGFIIDNEVSLSPEQLKTINDIVSKYNILKCVIPMFRGTMGDGNYKDVITQPILKTATSIALNLFKKKEDKKNANGGHAGLNIKFHTGLKTNKKSIQQYIDNKEIINKDGHKNVYEITLACLKLFHPITSKIIFNALKKELKKIGLFIYKGSIYDIIPARTKEDAYKYMYDNDKNLQDRYVIHIGDGRNDAKMMNLIIYGEKKSIGIAWGKKAKKEVKDAAVTNLDDATILANEIKKETIDIQTLKNNSIDGTKADLYNDDTTTTSHHKTSQHPIINDIRKIISTINPFDSGIDVNMFGLWYDNKKPKRPSTQYDICYNPDDLLPNIIHPNTSDKITDVDGNNTPKTMFRGKI